MKYGRVITPPSPVKCGAILIEMSYPLDTFETVTIAGQHQVMRVSVNGRGKHVASGHALNGLAWTVVIPANHYWIIHSLMLVIIDLISLGG